MNSVLHFSYKDSLGVDILFGVSCISGIRNGGAWLAFLI